MSLRKQILKEMTKRDKINAQSSFSLNSENFGKYVFSRQLMQKMLPKDVYCNIVQASVGQEKLKPEYADTIAVAIKEWAMSQGATHYSHWFQPLTGLSAEKHDSFIDWDQPDGVIEKFNGKQLIQGEPDASSFPSGGLRSTYEARGYTGWDPASPIFLWNAGDGVTLCIPSIFFSWTGDVLDTKIPLLRSEAVMNQAVLRLLKLTGLPAKYVYSTIGLEQEYFVVDRALRNLRPDLILLGKTVQGAPSPKGQELQDHYFGTVKDRILAYMQDFEEAAIELGIPVKTRHNEVAPAQHEIAPVFEKSSTAVDHNLLLMELMRRFAEKHGLACLLHEKPFHAINGSGKHCNWSISTNEGINLFDPSDTPHNNFHFLILLTAILYGVYQHGALLRASVGSASNDYRLGGHEAPPAIISTYLGHELEELLEEIEKKGMPSTVKKVKGRYNLKLAMIPELSQDNTDRNRTSPLAFTGNKFEFRAVGSSANPAFSITILNLLVAESLTEILDEIEKELIPSEEISSETLLRACMPVLQKFLKLSKPIRFTGDNYSEAWVKEAKNRGLPNLKHTPESLVYLTDPKTVRLFENILTDKELASRQEIALENYALHLNIEVNLVLDMFKTQIYPAAINYQKSLATSFLKTKEALSSHAFHTTQQMQVLKEYYETLEECLDYIQELEIEQRKAKNLPILEQAHAFSRSVFQALEKVRYSIDRLETMSDDEHWPLPKYRELLFMV